MGAGVATLLATTGLLIAMLVFVAIEQRVRGSAMVAVADGASDNWMLTR